MQDNGYRYRGEGNKVGRHWQFNNLTVQTPSPDPAVYETCYRQTVGTALGSMYLDSRWTVQVR